MIGLTGRGRSVGTVAALTLMAAALQSCATSPRAGSGEAFRLVEFTPWLATRCAPGDIQGVVYFVLGWNRRPVIDRNRLAPYFVKTLSENCWDVIAAKVPENLPNHDVAKRAFEHNGVPHRIVDHPAAFNGHFAGWLPLYDYEFGRCIVSFMKNPKTGACTLSALSSGDFCIGGTGRDFRQREGRGGGSEKGRSVNQAVIPSMLHHASRSSVLKPRSSRLSSADWT